MRSYWSMYDADDYRYFLQLYSQYDDVPYEGGDKGFHYCMNDDNLEKLRDEYALSEIAGDGSILKRLIRLMVWVHDALIGDGSCVPYRPLNSLSVLHATETQHVHSNCYTYAVVLNEVFLSMGIYSRMIRCMPCDLEYTDCHCVTVAYLDDYQKWVVFDPANRSYYVNEKMEPLGLMEMRSAILQGRKIYVPMMARDKLQGLLNYWTKNLVRFECSQVSAFGIEDAPGNRIVYHLNPSLLRVSDKVADFGEFKLNHIHLYNPNTFWQTPVLSK